MAGKKKPVTTDATDATEATDMTETPTPAKKAVKKKAAVKKMAVQTVKKPAVARKKRAEKPTSGQSGPSVALKREKLNEKEIKVVGVLASDINPMPINGIAATAFPDKDTKQSNSWVRNSLRRLVRGQWVEKMAKGTYRLSEVGTGLYSAAPAAEATVSA